MHVPKRRPRSQCLRAAKFVCLLHQSGAATFSTCPPHGVSPSPMMRRKSRPNLAIKARGVHAPTR
jgi:hypothetical protein